MIEFASCRNCDARLQGPWCHACGQSTHDFHRSTRHLVAEAVESFFHADSRLWRTLGGLATRPSRLTRNYIDGRRAAQIPPLRLFLVTLLVLFLVAGWRSRGMEIGKFEAPQATIQAEIDKSQVHLGLSPKWDEAATSWLHTHLGAAAAHPDALASAMLDRAETFAFLMLPISAFILAAIFIFRRGFVLFDHLVFSMHSLSFQGMLISLAMMARVLAGGWAESLLLWCAPVHLFVHLRGVYRLGTVGTLARMCVLAMLSGIAFTILLLGLVVLGLQRLRA